MDQIPDLIEARRFANNMRAFLPSCISVAALGVKSKTPYKLLCAREAVFWRTEELARGACDRLENGDLASGILLVRAVIECTAFVWRLYELLEGRQKHQPDELDKKFEQLLLGWTKSPPFPERINILTIIEQMNKVIPDARKAYDFMSEFAHPNWSGVMGLFSSTDFEGYITRFGRFPNSAVGIHGATSTILLASLETFDHAYNSISDLMPKFISELDPL